ncbi:hypothetical protein [Dethiothermospora halolimnae]
MKISKKQLEKMKCHNCPWLTRVDASHVICTAAKCMKTKSK